jgi:glutamate-1-semialdehyde 2,1-aminomutase
MPRNMHSGYNKTRYSYLKTERSRQLFQEAQKYLPGGVNSPVRAFKAVGGTPHFIVSGQGSRIFDADCNEFIDYVGSWGPLILGHCYPSVNSSLKKAIDRGTSFGAATELETQLAKMISKAIPSIEMIRFVNSGTEAVMSVIRLARAYTGRNIIVKFEGCYHGHIDEMLTKSGSGLATLGIPGSSGVLQCSIYNVVTLPYNNTDALTTLFYKNPDTIAAVIVEPVSANMGIVLPQPGFLESLRKLTSEFGALLIFDEVITGFRVAFGGAQAVFNIKPDLTCLGKIIGGGLPVGAYGGRRKIMEMVAPVGPVYQAGTLSGNPLAMTAGIETLKVLELPKTYEMLEARSETLKKGIITASLNSHTKVYVSCFSSLLTLFFSSKPVIDYASAKQSDTVLYSKYFHNLLSSGIYWPPSQFESAFISLAHSDSDIDKTIEVIATTLNLLQR